MGSFLETYINPIVSSSAQRKVAEQLYGHVKKLTRGTRMKTATAYKASIACRQSHIIHYFIMNSSLHIIGGITEILPFSDIRRKLYQC